jgi:DNA-binding NarL/FixJ family response regulator
LFRSESTSRPRDGNHSVGSSAQTNDIRATLVFVGSSVVFSDRLMRLVDFEFDGAEVLRLRDQSELKDLDPTRRHSIKLLILDEAATQALTDTSGRISRAAPEANVVLAYRDNHIARALFAQRSTLRIKEDLRFLPMKAPIDAWLATLRLLYLGESLVPAELLEVGDPQDATPPSLVSAASTDTVGRETAEPASDTPKLTSREAEILGMVAEGRRNKCIASDLGLSEHTVKLHVHHIFGKLGVGNRTSATNWYFAHSGNSAQHGR